MNPVNPNNGLSGQEFVVLVPNGENVAVPEPASSGVIAGAFTLVAMIGNALRRPGLPSLTADPRPRRPIQTVSWWRNNPLAESSFRGRFWHGIGLPRYFYAPRCWKTLLRFSGFHREFTHGGVNGARYRVRTCDPYRVKVMLYH